MKTNCAFFIMLMNIKFHTLCLLNVAFEVKPEVKPARYRSSLELQCNCSSTIAKEDIHSRQWIEYRNDKVQIVQNARDNWGPRLYSKSEILLLQVIDSKYLKENISYVCSSTLFNGSSVLYANYSVKGYGKYCGTILICGGPVFVD